MLFLGRLIITSHYLSDHICVVCQAQLEAVISSCETAQQWQLSLGLFETMILQSISPDVVCLNAVPLDASSIQKDAVQCHVFTISGDVVYVHWIFQGMFF